jgi:membrane-bound lytic murein transglycosylase A
MARGVGWLVLGCIVGSLAACAVGQRPPPADGGLPLPAGQRGAVVRGDAAPPSVDDPVPSGPVVQRARSRWVPVRWAALPGWERDDLTEAWSAWVRGCERPPAGRLAALCREARALLLADDAARRQWLMAHFQPHQVLSQEGGGDEGLLTGYFEPQLRASRVRQGAFQFPVYRPPASLAARKPWYSRQEMDTLPEAQAALRGREIAWLDNALDALSLQIQGSGRLVVREPDGRESPVRVAFAGTNDQPYRSVGRWLLDRGLVRDASWPGIKAWAVANPARTSEMLWSNPRVVFFREEPLAELDAAAGPRGAQGVALTPGRSIAVDPGSIPYGTPVWLSSRGPLTSLDRLVMAQDTGSAIVGGVRADYFTGWGVEAGELAGRLKQPLRLWVLWPK